MSGFQKHPSKASTEDHSDPKNIKEPQLESIREAMMQKWEYKQLLVEYGQFVKEVDARPADRNDPTERIDIH